MDRYPLMVLCKKIRDLASTKSLKVNHGIKSPEWKMSLLSLISDDVVLKQLEFIHPFQYVPEHSTAGYHVFRLSFFKYSIYVKIDKELTKVISFHYDEIPKEPKHINEYYLDSIDETRLQIITSGLRARRYVPLALGSFIVKLYPEDIYTGDDGTEFISLRYLQSQMSTSEDLQKLVLDRLSAVDPDLDYFSLTTKDTNLLTWVDEDKMLQTISFLVDAAVANPNMSWIKDTCVDIILSNPELQSALTKYNTALYPKIDPIVIDKSRAFDLEGPSNIFLVDSDSTE